MLLLIAFQLLVLHYVWKTKEIDYMYLLFRIFVLLPFGKILSMLINEYVAVIVMIILHSMLMKMNELDEYRKELNSVEN